jgi:hypothetical protein
VFTARYAPSPYIKRKRFVFKGLRDNIAMAYIGRKRYYLLFAVLAGSSGGNG